MVWRTYQKEELVWITGNPNKRGPDSLEAVIEAENSQDRLAVITLANQGRVLRDRLHAEKVAETLLDCLRRIDEFRGARRLFVQ